MMMFLWVALPILCMVGVAVYLYRKWSGAIACFLPKWPKKRRRIVSVGLTAALILPAFRIYDSWFIILLHFTVFLLVVDGAAWVVRKIRKNKELSPLWNKIYRSGVIAMILTALLCGYGHYNIYQVVQTDYTVTTQKEIRPEGYRLVLLSDLHYGISLDGAELQAVVDRINETQPDAVILDGDLVDESTTLEGMQEAFRVLGHLQSTYGTYYVYGNHDQNNYASAPNYTREQLAATIRENGITILEDESVTLGSDLTLIGRADRGDGTFQREEISELTESLDPDQEWILLDHQPADYEKAQQAGCDMILSGHTHAGQIWPAGLFATLFHFDELNYGEKDVGNLHAIVTSGIAGWGYPMRTERHSEYVVIQLMPNS